MCVICMGMKIKAKFDGSCKNCGETWVVDDEINYHIRLSNGVYFCRLNHNGNYKWAKLAVIRN